MDSELNCQVETNHNTEYNRQRGHPGTVQEGLCITEYMENFVYDLEVHNSVRLPVYLI